MVTYEQQMEWMRSMHQALRSPWMDAFFKAWDWVDSAYFILLAVAIVWHLIDKRIGVRLFYIFAIGSVANKFLKLLFHQPRPCQIDPLLGILCNESYGFPSGAAQMAMLIAGIIFIECKKWTYRILGLLFALFLCFSRVYLGVHFPTDILGGLVAGGGTLWIYAKVFPLCEKEWKGAALAFPCFLLLLGAWNGSFSWGLRFFFVLMGVWIGLMIDENAQAVKKSVRIVQTCVVVGGLFCLFFLDHTFPRLSYLWFFSEGIWLSFLGGGLVRRLKKN